MSEFSSLSSSPAGGEEWRHLRAEARIIRMLHHSHQLNGVVAWTVNQSVSRSINQSLIPPSGGPWGMGDSPRQIVPRGIYLYLPWKFFLIPLTYLYPRWQFSADSSEMTSWRLRSNYRFCVLLYQKIHVYMYTCIRLYMYTQYHPVTSRQNLPEHSIVPSKRCNPIILFE